MRRIILSLIVIVGVISAVAIGGTRAFFSDTETSAHNTFTAGAIDLKTGNESYYNGTLNPGTTWSPDDLNNGTETLHKFFDFGDVKPADYGEDTVSLDVHTNDAYLCANVTLTSNNDNGLTEPEIKAGDTTDGPGNGELAQHVNFIWWIDDGDNVLEQGEPVISQGSLGSLPIGQPYPIALADSATNIFTGTPGPLSGNTTYHIGKAWCIGTLTPAPLPQGSYPDGPAGDNNHDGTAGEPQDGGIICDGSTVGNEVQSDSVTADVSFDAVQARNNSGFLCERPPVACEPGQEWADATQNDNQGVRADGSPVLASRSDPAAILGPAQTTGTPYDSSVVPGSFFSLGFSPDHNIGGGSIVVVFTDNIVVDGSGADLSLYEVTGGSSYPDEKVSVEVSQDGVTYQPIPGTFTRDASIDISPSGYPWIRYVKVTDESDKSLFESTADGYDLDAVKALNCAQPPTI